MPVSRRSFLAAAAAAFVPARHQDCELAEVRLFGAPLMFPALRAGRVLRVEKVGAAHYVLDGASLLGRLPAGVVSCRVALSRIERHRPGALRLWVSILPG